MSGPAAPLTPPPLLTDELPVQPIVDQVLAELQQQLGSTLDEQVRLAMAPALARLTEQLLHEARRSLARSLREQVHQAVMRALASRPRP